MSIVLDIILIAIVIAIVVSSAKKGFVITVLELVAFVAAIFLAFQCATPTANLVYSSLFESSVQRELQEKIPENPKGLTYVQKAQYALDGMPDFVKNYAVSVGIDVDAIAVKIADCDLENNNKLYVSIEKEIVKPIAISVLRSIMFFLLSIVFGFILKALAKSINRLIKKSKLLGPANSILGGGFGVLKGLVVVFLLCCILSYIQPRFTNKTISDGIKNSAIVQAAEDFNPMDLITESSLLQNIKS